jgi:dienelactone hydrolase
MDHVLAKPADLCCLKGHFHTGEPTGSIEQIEGVDTYVAKPDTAVSNGNVLLFFPDAFGLHINSFLMMDAFAACGYLTLGVDYFLGVRIKVRSTATHILTRMNSLGCRWKAFSNSTK